ncbi:MAG TPA: ZIP family metal transporter [Solirubrobacteraceae bacterium]|nr:ZIP family metal transporter [Solirubrobacteraceae bacterium]
MAAHGGTHDAPMLGKRRSIWALGLVPLALIAIAVALFATLGAPGLGERRGPPAEELLVERTVLRPGEIQLTVRNDGPDAVGVTQVAVNDAYVDFAATDTDIGRLDAERLTIPYEWIEGEAYELFLLTTTGGVVEHGIDVAVATPDNAVGFFGLMALLGVYVGVIPVAIGMLWLPFVRRISGIGLRFLMALTIGLLAFLALDATLEGVELFGAESGAAESFGGVGLVFVGAALAYLALSAVQAHLESRQERARAAGAGGAHLALLVAIGIGLHNLGEGLAIGSAYAVGALALGAFLVIGFAIHNTTEGLAIVAPVASRRPSLGRLLVLGLIAGAPAILGAWIGAAAFNPSVAALLLGAGAGAIVQVIQQLAPSIRDRAGRLLYPASVGGIVAGMAILYVTGLLVTA